MRRASYCCGILTSPAFVLAVALLVLNDWVLKPAFGGWLTGKLSDLSGLFAFSLFWVALLPRHRNAVYLTTAFAFVLWKSPLMDAPLAAWNALGVWPLARAMDYTDWLALVALVPSYRLSLRYWEGSPGALSFRRLRSVAAAAGAIAAFAATSIAPPRHQLNDPTSYDISATGVEVRAGLQALDLQARYQEPNVMAARHRVAGDSLQLAVDTLLIYMRQPPERVVSATIEVRELGPSSVSIRLLSASAFGPTPTLRFVRLAFSEQVIDPLRAWLAQRPR